MNTPVVLLCNEHFMNDAWSAASSKQMPGIRCVALSVPSECSVIEQVEAGLGPAVINNIITALTEPLTSEEKSPKAAGEKPTRIAFKGNLEEVNRFYYKRGWTDGLPVIPPTEEAVREMLTGTDLPPDHVIGKIEPRLGKATIEKIAINAVMAGALPIYMPVLIAGVKGLKHSESRFAGLAVSTGSWVPFWIINGPIRNDLHINSGQGALSPGDIANATIGRAMGLIIKNIGGIRKGIEDMGTLGNPGKYTMVLGENEEENPWEPLHVEHGFKKDDSTITFNFPNCFWQTVSYGTDDRGILRSLSYNLLPMWGGTLSIILIPIHAKILAGKGWTKRTIADFISNYARTPLHRLPQYYGSLLGLPGKTDKQLIMDSDDSVPIIENSNMIRIVVAGGAGSFIGLAQGGVTWTTKKIDLPANWDNLITKYKDMVPAHIRY